MGTPDPAASALRLAWCAVPLAATVYFAIAVARTDPGTRPRPGLSAIGLGPARLMAVSAATTALSCALGSLLALLVFLQLRGDLAGTPSGGATTDFLAAGTPLPLPAALTLLALVPLSASAAVAVTLRPREPVTGTARAVPAYGRFGAYRRTPVRESFGTYGRFGRQLATAGRSRPPPPRWSRPRKPRRPPRPRPPCRSRRRPGCRGASRCWRWVLPWRRSRAVPAYRVTGRPRCWGWP
ncbi:hypothetical protein SHKM778_21050 [Streptomyces sp. KM77-8]|uniref:ABC transporter permease n=1 Tax=Streptomyces haneummycinicus TaxID=3074435 RepID=A0AAT9HEE7_9ACTN